MSDKLSVITDGMTQKFRSVHRFFTGRLSGLGGLSWNGSQLFQ